LRELDRSTSAHPDSNDCARRKGGIVPHDYGARCPAALGLRRNIAMTQPSRRDIVFGAGALAAVPPLLGATSALGRDTGGYDPSMTVSLKPEELAKFKNPALIKHLQSAKPLVNKARAYEIMDKYGLDGLVASIPRNVYYLSSHDNAFYRSGIDHLLYAFLPRKEEAPAALIIWGALLYHLDYRPTWMPSVQVYTAPAAMERGAELTREEAAGDPPAIRYNRNFVRKGATYTDRDKIQLAIAAEYADKTAASSLHALKRAIVQAGLTKGKLGFDDPRMIPWMKDVGLLSVTGVDAIDIFREVRMVKTQNELEIIRQSCRMAESALNAAIDSLHVGQPIADVEYQYNKKMGAEGGSTKWLVVNQDGLNSGNIVKDAVIKIDSVGEYQGYVADIGRTIVVGTPSDETAKRNEANTKALQTAYREIRPGMKFGQAGKIVADVMAQEGFNGYASPHNVGLEHTDQPASFANPLIKREAPVFAEGTVFTIDVPYLEIGYGSSHVEDMMVVTKSGAVPISTADTTLRVKKA
jgi:Xaa-Pro aminopeptidase